MAKRIRPAVLGAGFGIYFLVVRDIDELLESLSEVEATATREVQAMDSNPQSGSTSYGDEDDTKLGSRRQRLIARRKFLGRYLIGPGLVAGVILGISGMMLPGADGFAQYNHHFNTALILGIGYAWIGVGWYIALTVFALVGGRDSGGRKK